MRTLNTVRAVTFGVTALLGSTSALAAHAQVVERNLPPSPTSSQPLVGANAIAADEDDTPIGPALSGIVLLDTASPVRTGPTAGIDTSAVARMNTEAGRGALAPYLGRPLSRQLIAEIEATIARFYRANGYPFVSLSTPPQEVTSGVLQVRVVEFVLGDVNVQGTTRTDPTSIRNRVRVTSGQPINGDDLAEDLDWLNRNPFRNVEAVFSPGDQAGESDLRLVASESRPFRVYGGYSNAGTPSTGRDRYFAGVSALIGSDAVVSYQFTGGDEAFDDTPNYVSHAANLFVPFGARQAFELNVSQVESNAAVAAFDVTQKTLEISGGYVGALSNFSALRGDVSFGLEYKEQSREVYFGPVLVLDQPLNVYQLYAGWALSASDRLGRHAINASVHYSPGGIGSDSEDADFAAYTSGRVTQADYVYLRGGYDRVTRLGQGIGLVTQIFGQISGDPLPESERLGVGGMSLARGYSLDDGAYDTGLVVRNELRVAAISQTYGPALVSPFGFVDAAYGKDEFTGDDITPVSVGVGVDIRLFDRATLSTTAGYALNDAIDTQSGDWRTDVRLTAAF